MANSRSILIVGPTFATTLSKLPSCGARCQVLIWKKKKNQVGSAYSRQQLPGKSAGLQASVRRVQLPDAFTEHPQLLVRPCVCSTERSTQLLGQLSLLREVVFWKKMYTAHVKASGKTSFTFLSVPHFLESKSCTRACAAIRGSIALSK